jgi:hypothetical protein
MVTLRDIVIQPDRNYPDITMSLREALSHHPWPWSYPMGEYRSSDDDRYTNLLDADGGEILVCINCTVADSIISLTEKLL